VGCECAQVFAKTPRRWVASRRPADDARRFTEDLRGRGIDPVVTHAGYLINIGSGDDTMRERSIEALADEIERATDLEASCVVVHAGTRVSDDDEACAARAGSALGEAHARACGRSGRGCTRVLVENSAGSGRSWGATAAELLATVGVARAAGALDTGVCIDTCHAVAAGIDLRSARGWAVLLDELGRGPAGVLGVVHANDCMGGLGEHRDRHAWIGDGSVGESGFLAMLSDPRLAGIPAIVEMPGERPRKDEENLRRLRALRDVVAAFG
jgi:deoxyribonuclease-4